ncbi:4548_t:CDS:1 [Acaulospora morrowiae]|uniref:4548_t:CDS:1 n=1 Tax=Acaulospora morrowiae TaxID=94023 RepID=A0A9N9BJH8_9GLOM|nr:4548_t:CDS:1 [Acaulospora morrowiae]
MRESETPTSGTTRPGVDKFTVTTSDLSRTSVTDISETMTVHTLEADATGIPETVTIDSPGTVTIDSSETDTIDSSEVTQYSIVIYPTTYTSPVTYIQTATTTVSLDNSMQLPNADGTPQIIILVAVILGSIGLVFILSIITIYWLRRDSKVGNERELEDDSMLGTDSMLESDNQNDEQLPSYAEAIVRGRADIQ